MPPEAAPSAETGGGFLLPEAPRVALHAAAQTAAIDAVKAVRWHAGGAWPDEVHLRKGGPDFLAATEALGAAFAPWARAMGTLFPAFVLEQIEVKLKRRIDARRGMRPARLDAGGLAAAFQAFAAGTSLRLLDHDAIGRHVAAGGRATTQVTLEGDLVIATAGLVGGAARVQRIQHVDLRDLHRHAFAPCQADHAAWLKGVRELTLTLDLFQPRAHARAAARAVLRPKA